jgi:hypothetical protein
MRTSTRTSRWTTRQPDNPPHRLEPGDVEILKCLARYTLATNRDIAAYTNRSYKVICRRTQRLKNSHLRVCSAQLNNPRLYQRLPQAFHLTPRGVSKLAEIGIEVDVPKSSGQFVHRLTECQTALSFELGCRERGLEIIYPADAPAVIPNVPFILHDREYCQAVKADWRPFVILHPNEQYRFFPGFGTDCDSEDLTSTAKTRAVIEQKFAAYLTILQRRMYEQHFKVANFVVLFIAPHPARKQAMMDLLEKLTRGKNANHLLAAFGLFAMLTEPQEASRPFGDDPSRRHLFRRPRQAPTRRGCYEVVPILARVGWESQHNSPRAVLVCSTTYGIASRVIVVAKQVQLANVFRDRDSMHSCRAETGPRWNVRSRRTLRSGARRAESDSRRRD